MYHYNNQWESTREPQTVPFQQQTLWGMTAACVSSCLLSFKSVKIMHRRASNVNKGSSHLLLRGMNKETPTPPPELPPLCYSVRKHGFCSSHKPLLTPAHHPSESPGCCGRNTETTLTPTKTKNTLCKMNSVMPFDNNPQTAWERRTPTSESRLDSRSCPLGFLYGQHNLKTYLVLKGPRFFWLEISNIDFTELSTSPKFTKNLMFSNDQGVKFISKIEEYQRFPNCIVIVIGFHGSYLAAEEQAGKQRGRL